jgi:hypothetical protein
MELRTGSWQWLGPGFQNEVKWRFGGAAKAAKASAVYNYLTQSFLSGLRAKRRPFSGERHRNANQR